MKLIRFLDAEDQIRYGIPVDDRYQQATVITGDIYSDYQPTEEQVTVKQLLSPTAGAILGIGCNYRRLAEHLGATVPPYPVTYFSLPNALNHHGGTVPLPKTLAHKKTKYEGELVVVIGKTGKNIAPENALEYAFGYTIGNDICTGEWQGPNVGGQWAKGKGFDGYKPAGPCLVTADEITEPNCLPLRTELNGIVVQDDNTADMIHPVETCISFVSQGHSLHPGDLIFTGTPFGTPGCHDQARFLQPDDTIRVSIPGIGCLENRIELES
jgi:2-keto-4-pentenoate hydratase/2-oxohepta-3-ene-1,7-dioic acid hydratase in catechol pathway